MRLFLVICFSFVFISHSQSNKPVIDSLLQLTRISNDTVLVKAFNELSWEYKNVDIDSSMYYSKKSLEVALELNNKKAIAASYNSLANSFDGMGQLDSALVYHKKSLDLKLEIAHKVGAADSYNNLGIVYDLKGDFDLSLEHYFNALNIYENEKVPFYKVPMVLTNIGIVYKKQKEYEKVLEYYNKALKIYTDNNYDFGIVITKGNIGSVLINLKKFKESIKFCAEAKDLYEKLGYKRYVPYMLSNMAFAKDSLKIHKQSQEDFEEAIKLFTEDKNLYELVHTKIGLANNLKKQQKFITALNHGKEALEIAKSEGFKEWEVKAYRILADVEKLRKNYHAYSAYLELHTIRKDSLFEESKTKTIFELETKYQTAKKEKEILSQRAEIAEKELKLDRNRNQIIGLITLAVALSILGYLLYNQQKLKNRQLQKENELKEALAEIETHNKLQEQRLRISRDLHDNIGAQLTFIISSIENLQYGFKLTNAKLKDKLTGISAFTKETIYELRDTIWAMNKDEITLEDLKARISNFIEKANASSSNMRFKIDINDNAKGATVFSSLMGMNIYRIIQEAVNNAIKYAEASSIEVVIKKKESTIHFTITDNGKGFNIESVEEGNGLNNMTKRATDINADISYISTIGEGTIVSLSLNT
ncbi:tetratricopeptide repeat-containing sensor histidine kinase [Seonamhaeicola marinus]|uniref:histidine kinase n=1 Tax=Seonamhaeicola marinus TaxID=1912246 RepID=A0A5D0HUI3_9FLAO|nr:tetratricopeptide repeat protein [Seonamhaeicola marinus]TYA74985.1 tetratricopeptide repeat protein [Seonamhaeicola marinus]